MVEQSEENLTRFKKPAMALAGGIGAALVIATLPHVYLESMIGATGVSEILPAAAPPLGNTARSLIAIAAGLVTASAIFFFLNRNEFNTKGGSDMGLALRKNLTSDEPVSEKPRFAFPKFSLKKLLQKPVRSEKQKKGKVMDLADLPQLREADSHPDAPARKPISAETDLGSPLADQIKPFENENGQSEAESPVQIAPTTFTDEKSLPAPDPVLSAEEPVLDMTARFAQQTERDEDEINRSARAGPVEEDLSQLSIAQLADRLEAGLKRLKELESIDRGEAVEPETGGINIVSSDSLGHTPPPLKPVETRAEEPVETRQADMDAALKAALGTLEKMTAQR